MTTHPGYPPGYHSVQECRKQGRCWWCFKIKPVEEFVNKPCCAKCKREMTVEA